MFTNPGLTSLLAREHYRQILAEASRRQLRRQHGHQATSNASGAGRIIPPPRRGNCRCGHRGLYKQHHRAPLSRWRQGSQPLADWPHATVAVSGCRRISRGAAYIGEDANVMHDDLTALVTRARTGDKQAWDDLVQRYAPLIWSICGRYRLGRADAEDAGQSVWLRLVGHLASIRDPAALPGWIATTTQRECGRVLRAARQQQAPGRPLDAADIPGQVTGAAESELLRAERYAALRDAFRHLPPGSRKRSPCPSRTLRCPTPRSAPGWASRSGASDRAAVAAWTSCAVIRPSPP